MGTHRGGGVVDNTASGDGNGNASNCVDNCFVLRDP